MPEKIDFKLNKDGTFKIPKWRVITTNKRGDTGTHGSWYTKRDAQHVASNLRKKNKDMIKNNDKFWIGYKSIKIEKISKPKSGRRRKK